METNVGDTQTTGVGGSPRAFLDTLEHITGADEQPGKGENANVMNDGQGRLCSEVYKVLLSDANGGEMVQNNDPPGVDGGWLLVIGELETIWEIGEPSHRPTEMEERWGQSFEDDMFDMQGENLATRLTCTSDLEPSRVCDSFSQQRNDELVEIEILDSQLMVIVEVLGVSWQEKRQEVEELFSKIVMQWNKAMEEVLGGEGGKTGLDE